MATTYDRVQNAIKIFESKSADLTESKRALLGALVIGDVITEIYQTECLTATDADRAALKADLLQLFHDVFNSITIPYVPAAFKGVLAGLLEQPLEQGLDLLHNEFATLRAEVDAALKG